MRTALRRALAASVLAVVMAGCRFIVPADGDPTTLPQPGASRGAFPSPSLEIPPPVY